MELVVSTSFTQVSLFWQRGDINKKARGGYFWSKVSNPQVEANHARALVHLAG